MDSIKTSSNKAFDKFRYDKFIEIIKKRARPQRAKNNFKLIL